MAALGQGARDRMMTANLPDGRKSGAKHAHIAGE
jgi:hypothetical protein